jgi:hypothetical protein
MTSSISSPLFYRSFFLMPTISLFTSNVGAFSRGATNEKGGSPLHTSTTSCPSKPSFFPSRNFKLVVVDQLFILPSLL